MLKVLVREKNEITELVKQWHFGMEAIVWRETNAHCNGGNWFKWIRALLGNNIWKNIGFGFPSNNFNKKIKINMFN